MITARGTRSGSADRPLQRALAAHRTADDRGPALDPERVGEQDLDRNLIADRDRRKSGAVRVPGRGIDRRRTGRALAPAEHVRADHEEPVRVDRALRTDKCVPPPGLGVTWLRAAGGMTVAGERVEHEHRVRSIGGERAPRLVGDGDRPEAAARRATRAAARSRPSRTVGVRAGPPASTHRLPEEGSPHPHQHPRTRVDGLRTAETGVEVGEDVVESLDADREPHETGRDPGQLLLGDIELTVRRAGRVDREASARRRRWRGG